MTVKLNLTIDEKIVAISKRYASKNKTTVSKMVQELLRSHINTTTKRTSKKSFIANHAATLSGKLSDITVKKIKDHHLSAKYGY